MRGVRPGLRHVLVLIVVALSLVGCSSSSGDDATVKPGSGQIVAPTNTPEATASGEGMKQQGAMMNDARAQAAAAEAAAKAQSGGK